jgi:hypothetical protein
MLYYCKFLIFKEIFLTMKRLSLVVALVLLLLVAAPVLAQDPDPGTGAVNFTVQNLGGAETTVVAQYVNQSGVVDAEIDKVIGALASEGFPAADSGLDDGWAGSVVISAGENIAAFGQALWTNSALDPSEARYRTAGAYNGFQEGANTLYLPSLAKRDGAQLSRISVQSAVAPNTGTPGDVAFTIEFYDRDGNLSHTYNGTTKEAAQATINLADISQLTSPWLGAAVITADDPSDLLAAVATTHWTNYSAAYSAVAGGGTKVALPSATRRNPQGDASVEQDPDWVQYTAVVVQNLDAGTPSNVTVTWYDRDGTELYSFNDTISANSAKGYNTRFIQTSNVPDADKTPLGNALGPDWNGSVVIDADTDVVAVANLQWAAHPATPNTASAYTSIASGTPTVYVPATFRRGIDGTVAGINTQFTGLIVQNVGTTACTDFDVNWYPRGSTTAALSYQDSLDPNISHGYNTKQGASGSDFPASVDVTSLGFDFRGSVVIQGAVGCELAAIHNTVWPVWTDNTTYNAFAGN